MDEKMVENKYDSSIEENDQTDRIIEVELHLLSPSGSSCDSAIAVINTNLTIVVKY